MKVSTAPAVSVLDSFLRCRTRALSLHTRPWKLYVYIHPHIYTYIRTYLVEA